jgi:hypothetical protein
LVGFAASLVQLGPCFFEPESSRRLRAFLARNDAVQAQRVLNFDELAGCYTAGWAVFITEGTQIISYLPSDPRGSLRVKWSTAQVLSEEGGQVEFKLPVFMYNGPDGFTGSGDNRVRLPAVPGRRERIRIGLVLVEVQTLLSGDYRTVFVLGIRSANDEQTSTCFAGAVPSAARY